MADKHLSNVFSVGADGETGCATHTWYGCSYGAIHILGNSNTRAFEMTTGGLGIQYCGAHLRSDSTTVFGRASRDGIDDCEGVDTLCVLASDVTTEATCGEPLMTFSLDPLGRRAVTAGDKTFAPSKYPAAPTLVFDGTSRDAVHFGPTAPTPGVGNFHDVVFVTPDAGAGDAGGP